MAAYTSGTRYRKDCTNYFISMGCLWEAMIVQCWHCNKYCEVVSTLEVRHKHTLFHSVYYHGNFLKYTKLRGGAHCHCEVVNALKVTYYACHNVIAKWPASTDIQRVHVCVARETEPT